ncbi:Uncharacterised protein [Anaerobiospirillum thomasii]|nr:Uncharacterised protein [Anaerobiospirillum thomasii]
MAIMVAKDWTILSKTSFTACTMTASAVTTDKSSDECIE